MLPRQLAAIGHVSGATPLGLVRDRLGSAPAGSDPLSILATAGIRVTEFDHIVTDALNNGLFSRIGAALPSGYVDLLVGNRSGAIGEISGILLLAASIVLISRGVVRWKIPASIVGGYSLLVWTFGGLPLGNGFFAGDVLFSLLTGSFLLVAFFMAPDPVTSPSSTVAMIVYGLGIGSIIFALRLFGSGSDGSAFAVLVMNCFVPLLERIVAPTRVKKVLRAENREKCAETEGAKP
jgi:Na+-translocating ferredoxin:NAD+ oxidoreductase RnfD subunit